MEKALVQRDDLGHVGNRILRQPRQFCGQCNISWRQCPFQIACQGNADHCCDAAVIESIRLDNGHGPSKPRTRTRWLGQIGPPYLTLGDYHSLFSRTRRAADPTKLSSSPPISAQARFIASVILSGSCRARYSFKASLNKRLRDLFVFRARRSAPSKMSSGIDTAVFIPGV